MRAFATALFALTLTSSATLVVADDNSFKPRRTDLSAESMTDFYQGCLPSCIQRQRSAPEKQRNLDFFINAYCACYCTHLATQSSAQDLAETKKQGKPTDKFSAIVQRSADVCLRALTSN